MTIPVIKNIKYGYVQVKNGIASLDTSMTDKAFDTNKPRGVYRCFTFQYENFGGYDYEDVQHLISVEESSIWDKIKRTTLLGYNLVTNEFIVNYNAWLSLKDADLKTDGELPHPSQAGWHEMILSTTKSSDSKFELNQIDGSKVYLSLKPTKIVDYNGTKVVTPSVSCIENKSKSTLGNALIAKENILWTKSNEDNSVILVNDCVPKITVDYGGGDDPYISQLLYNNNIYGDPNAIENENASSLVLTRKFGKRAFYFTSFISDKANTITCYTSTIGLKNKTTSENVELTNTNNLEDILASGESLTFYIVPKARAIRYIYNKTKNESYSYKNEYGDYIKYFSIYVEKSNKFNYTFSSYKDKTDEGIACDLISCDTRKPFVYSPNGKDIKINGIKRTSTGVYFTFKPATLFKNIPDGFIFLIPIMTISDTKKIYHLLRFKKNENIKIGSFNNPNIFASITGSTQFGNEIYSGSFSFRFTDTGYPISKDDVINATVFTDISNDDMNNIYNSVANIELSLVTVLRV